MSIVHNYCTLLWKICIRVIKHSLNFSAFLSLRHYFVLFDSSQYANKKSLIKSFPADPTWLIMSRPLFPIETFELNACVSWVQDWGTVWLAFNHVSSVTLSQLFILSISLKNDTPCSIIAYLFIIIPFVGFLYLNPTFSKIVL